MTAQLLQVPQPQAATLVHNVSWQQLEELDRALSKFGRFRLAYLDGTLELMPVSNDHEDFKKTIAILLEAYMRAIGVRFYGRGAPTMGSQAQGARKEPDESYNIETRKAYPDLVIEVVFTSGGVDKLEIYRRLGVREVWFWEDGVLAIYQLTDDRYTQIVNSGLLPQLPIETFLRYVTYHDQYDAVTEFLAEIGRGV
jgi:Uma2 family endonuclease